MVYTSILTSKQLTQISLSIFMHKTMIHKKHDSDYSYVRLLLYQLVHLGWGSCG